MEEGEGGRNGRGRKQDGEGGKNGRGREEKREKDKGGRWKFPVQDVTVRCSDVKSKREGVVLGGGRALHLEEEEDKPGVRAGNKPGERHRDNGRGQK